MTILPINPADNATPAGLRTFLAGCREAALARGRPQLVSISIEVDALDPLAVLESIFEPTELHFYCERPAQGFALAGAEAVVSAEAAGPDRFAAAQRFIDETLAHTLAVGDQAAPFAGPHFFMAFAFADEVVPGEPFPAARVFVPRWQVARAGERTVAVANLLVAPEADLDALTEKVWRAHAKFHAFDYAAPDFSAATAGAQKVSVVEPGDYPTAVRRGLECIAAGELQKIVLARAKDLAATQPLHPLRVLNGLRQLFADCYAFSVANGRGQSFIGASPERLLRVRENALLTEALAGSVRRGATASDDAALASALLHSDKDRREHRLVLDSIVRRLSPLGLKLEFAEKPGLLRLANVQHLHTPVRAVLPAGVRLLDALARLHPTPAVGGSPRERAMARLREFEGFSRGLYAGALGWLDARGDGEFFVGLRSALIDGAGARLYAGAGIVAGSSPEKEFAETELKFKAMQDALLAP
ncbi:MAG TPA: isochorismate synthase [Opitutaceae bacterium]|jgi:menaquinone-specific isochorismate synthase|nr:isochorismate synthase [Opitutaceae bacterium]